VGATGDGFEFRKVKEHDHEIKTLVRSYTTLSSHSKTSPDFFLFVELVNRKRKLRGQLVFLKNLLGGDLQGKTADLFNQLDLKLNYFLDLQGLEFVYGIQVLNDLVCLAVCLTFERLD